MGDSVVRALDLQIRKPNVNSINCQREFGLLLQTILSNRNLKDDWKPLNADFERTLE